MLLEEKFLEFHRYASSHNLPLEAISVGDENKVLCEKMCIRDSYIEGTTFGTVYHLYKVDEILRDTFRRYIEKAEVYYRTQIAYGFSIAKCTEAPYDQHYDENNFYNKKGYKEVMENFSREKNYYKDSKSY